MVIPVPMLPHRVTLTPGGVDTGDGITFGTPLPRIPARVELATRTVVDVDGRTVTRAAVVTIPPWRVHPVTKDRDELNPRPGDRLEHDGTTYRVVTVDGLDDLAGRRHHYELGVL